MKRQILIWTLFGLVLPSLAQKPMTLQQCRQLALDNNKQLKVSKLNISIAKDNRNVAKTKFLPRVDGLGGYEHFSKEISLLSDEKRASFSTMGTTLSGSIGQNLSKTITEMVQQGAISMESAQKLGVLMEKVSPGLAQTGNAIGESINEAFNTDTRNVWSAGILVTQPLYMGGAITAANEMARIGEEMAHNQVESATQKTLYAIDNAYWLTVSLRNKHRLALKYLSFVKKLDEDVQKCIREGVATKADGLKVDVAVNTAEMNVTKVEDGLVLSKMLLCQLCGLPLDSDITLADEEKEEIVTPDEDLSQENATTYENRSEIRLLQNTIDLTKQTTKLIKAEYMPHVALTGGVTFVNPSIFNGFEKKFTGIWNIGVILQVPIWNWHESRYKLNASRTATEVAQLELADVREKISLQVEQSRFKVKEARKQLEMAQKNLASADENLRCANVGYKEGVMTVTDVMGAQTAWQQAQSQKQDAEIDLRLALLSLQKALGILSQE